MSEVPYSDSPHLTLNGLVWAFLCLSKNTEKKWAGFLPGLLWLEVRHVPIELPAQETLIALQQPFLQIPEKETCIISIVQGRRTRNWMATDLHHGHTMSVGAQTDYSSKNI